MLNPIEASESIKDEFISYISTSFHLADQDYANQFESELHKKGAVTKGPYLDISDSFESGENIESLIEEGELSPLFRELEKNAPEKEKEIKLQRRLYRHQEKAIRKINQEHNLVVTTGTGSGKTECFILPIINHLLREKENETLSSGVRAILIYPMNALANDQMKRLRKILKDYPDITFGVYNSSTQMEDAEGIAEYGRIFKDINGHALKPLPNEAISRKTMQTTPPHILVTNYAMLEYMMLRPNDDMVFSGAQLKFLVLDEAHIYRGATGMETSLLLRRLKARISNSAEVRHILTSATLGGEEANKDIISFAETLCDATFLEDDIIRSKTVMPEFPEETVDYPVQLFAELANPVSITRDCNCSPSCYNCLRNYYNQAVHDILDRTEAYNFLKAFSGPAFVIPDEDFEERHEETPAEIVSESTLRFIESWPCGYNNWSELAVMIPDDIQSVFEDFDYYHVPLPSDAYCRCKIQGTEFESEALFVWKDKKMMLFDEDHPMLEVYGWTSLRVSEIKAKKFAERF